MITQMVKKFPAFDGIGEFVTVPSKARQITSPSSHLMFFLSYRTLWSKAKNPRLKFISLDPVLTIQSMVNMVLNRNNSRDFEAVLFQ
jgi:hypothetical protein